MMGIWPVGTGAHRRVRWRRGSFAQVDQAPIKTHAETYVEMGWLYKESRLLTATTAIQSMAMAAPQTVSPNKPGLVSVEPTLLKTLALRPVVTALN
jgi:hypothetical protein